MHRPPPDLQVAVRVGGIDDRERDAGITLHVLVLLAGLDLTEQDVAVVGPEPDRVVLWLAVRTNRGDMSQRRRTKQVGVAAGNSAARDHGI